MKNKLVRDKIPDIMRNHNKLPKFHIADEKEFRNALREKLKEEVAEYLESGEHEELADILEVLRALSDVSGISFLSIETIRRRKKNERGAFQKHIILEY